MKQLFYGGVPVPYTAGWTGEDVFYVDRCAYAGGLAICQSTARGEGKPQFAKLHAIRQRQVICQGLCDLCGKPLKVSTKVSLSHARPQMHSANGGEILQVEPLLHRECAETSMRHCPALKRDIQNGSLMVRQVTRFRVQCAVMSAEYVETITGISKKAIGHAKVELQAWIDRDERWLNP